MEFAWDEAKRLSNLAKHGVDFAEVYGFDWQTAVRWHDDRLDYGEVRYAALGLIGARVYSVTFTLRGPVYRIINLRKANDRETRRYEEEKDQGRSHEC